MDMERNDVTVILCIAVLMAVTNIHTDRHRLHSMLCMRYNKEDRNLTVGQ